MLFHRPFLLFVCCFSIIFFCLCRNICCCVSVYLYITDQYTNFSGVCDIRLYSTLISAFLSNPLSQVEIRKR
nr:hypothetical protein Itr_chr02CG02880 [Ipomoea trifida]